MIGSLAKCEESSKRDGVIVSGLYMEEVDDLPLLFYESLVPLVFEFKLYPELVPTSGTLTPEPRILSRFLCRTDDRALPSAGWAYTCPVMYHLSSLLTQLKVRCLELYVLIDRVRESPGFHFSLPNIFRFSVW
jgi:hypothetical protein